MSESLSTLTTFFEDLTSMKGQFDPKTTEYVCHTSSIPNCTVFDLKRDRKDYEKFAWYRHKECFKKHCECYSKRNDSFELEFVYKHCACKQIDTELKPVCWNTLLKKLEWGEDKADTIDLKTVMFCTDARGILEEKYPNEVVAKTAMRGFESIETDEHLISVLFETYWFCKYNTDMKLSDDIRALFKFCNTITNRKYAGKRFRNYAKSILLTMNGFILKKSIFLAEESAGYKDTARQTARAFKSLVREFSVHDPSELDEYSLYDESKEFFQFIKLKFNHEKLSVREHIFQYKYKNNVLKALFNDELRQIKRKLSSRKIVNLGDYSTSIMWKLRMSALAQTRVLDHVPYYKGRQKIHDFVKYMRRPLASMDERTASIIHTSIMKNLRDNEVPENLFRKEQLITEDLIKESIVLELKGTASTNFTVDEGGKLEDARILLRDAKINKWRVPIRDFDDFEQVGMTPLITESSWNEKGVLDLSNVIFWLSFQISLNFLCVYGMFPEKYYVEMPKDGDDEWFEEGLLNAKLVGIDEPGKLRMLMKVHAYLNWTLSPGSKLSQKGLAFHKDHKAGLELGTQDWNLNKRISGESPESGFLYEPTGSLKKEAVGGYSDFNEATNGLNKRPGSQSMKSYFHYTAFPKMYGQLILHLTRLPFSVEEVVHLFDGDILYRKKVNYTFNEGFMMGVQFTKTYLHLSHIVVEGLSDLYLEQKGFSFNRNRKDLRSVRPLIGPEIEISEPYRLS